MKNYNFVLAKSCNNQRLDKVIQHLVGNISRTRIQKAIDGGLVKVNKLIISDSNTQVKTNDLIFVHLPEPESLHMTATNIALDIIFEDHDLIVINKPAGLTVHPGAGNYRDTLANGLLYYTNSLSDIGGLIRPGIVHRLDKDTSGLMVVAKNNLAHVNLARQIETRQLVRRYQAVIWGVMNPLSGTIKANIGRSKADRKKMAILRSGGKPATTYYHTRQIFLSSAASLIECKLETGRTHQIRVHLSGRGHSLVGDQTYGHNNHQIKPAQAALAGLADFKRQALHSWYISFSHPVSNNILEFSSALPADISQLIEPILAAPVILN